MQRSYNLVAIMVRILGRGKHAVTLIVGENDDGDGDEADVGGEKYSKHWYD